MPTLLLDQNQMISFDGAELGLTVWEADGAPGIVIVGVHGMNDYANAFHMAAPFIVQAVIAVVGHRCDGEQSGWQQKNRMN